MIASLCWKLQYSTRTLSICSAGEFDSIEAHIYDVETQERMNETQILLYGFVITAHYSVLELLTTLIELWNAH